MFLLDWYQEYLEIRQASKSCDSCDTLRSQLDVANFEKQEILKRLLDKEAPSAVVTPHSTEIKKTVSEPWHVTRRRLERQSHLENIALQEKARALDNAAKPDTPIVVLTENAENIEKLEQEFLEDANQGNS